MNINLIHLHLLLNHFPTVGVIVAIGVLFLGYVNKSAALKRASLMVFLGLALITIPTYIAGSASHLLQMKTVSPTVLATIQAHRDRAIIGLMFMELLGSVAWLGLWFYRRNGRLSDMNTHAVAVLAVITLLAMTAAANIGGGIRHPEFLEAGDAQSIATAVSSGAETWGTSLGKFIVGAPWMWPVCETLHFIGLSLLLAVVFVVDLRMLGILKNVSFKTLHRLLPWAVLGLGVNVITGMLFFIGAPEQYVTNPAFHWKMLLLLIAGLNAVYFTVLDQPWVIAESDEAPLTAKVLALGAMVLWVSVMWFGSMLPFIGGAF